MLHFVKNDQEIILRCKWVYGSIASPTAGPRQSPRKSSGEKPPFKLPSKLIYFECKFEANLRLYVLKKFLRRLSFNTQLEN